jgi:hypothetical protein
VIGDLVGTDTVAAQGHSPWTGHARSGEFYPAKNGDLHLATSGDFFMATDIRQGVSAPLHGVLHRRCMVCCTDLAWSK